MAQAPRLILASASPARRETLIRAGLAPEVIVSAVDEDAFHAADVMSLVAVLARAKAEAVAHAITADEAIPEPDEAIPEPDEAIPEPDEGSLQASSGSASAAAALLIVGCDSLLELDGEPLGKPATATEAVRRWQRMRGRTGRLHTGHHVVGYADGRQRAVAAVATTEVAFADLTDAEIEAYVATGEPQQVAGAFTIDGLGGAYVTSVSGDPHNVVGISLPLLRQLFAELGYPWHLLWSADR